MELSQSDLNLNLTVKKTSESLNQDLNSNINDLINTNKINNNLQKNKKMKGEEKDKKNKNNKRQKNNSKNELSVLPPKQSRKLTSALLQDLNDYIENDTEDDDYEFEISEKPGKILDINNKLNMKENQLKINKILSVKNNNISNMSNTQTINSTEIPDNKSNKRNNKKMNTIPYQSVVTNKTAINTILSNFKSNKNLITKVEKINHEKKTDKNEMNKDGKIKKVNNNNNLETTETETEFDYEEIDDKNSQNNIENSKFQNKNVQNDINSETIYANKGKSNNKVEEEEDEEEEEEDPFANISDFSCKSDNEEQINRKVSNIYQTETTKFENSQDQVYKKNSTINIENMINNNKDNNSNNNNLINKTHKLQFRKESDFVSTPISLTSVFGKINDDDDAYNEILDNPMKMNEIKLSQESHNEFLKAWLGIETQIFSNLQYFIENDCIEFYDYLSQDKSNDKK